MPTHQAPATLSTASPSPRSPGRARLGLPRARPARERQPAVAWAACLPTACLFAVACGSTLQPIDLVAVEPHQAYNDLPTTLRVQTRNLRVSLDIDLARAALAAPLDADFALQSETDPAAAPVALANVAVLANDLFAAVVPSDLAMGSYSLVVTDRHEPRSAIASGAFESLGPDLDPPSLSIIAPADGATLPAGSDALAQISVDDGAGSIASVTLSVQVAGADPGAPAPLSRITGTGAPAPAATGTLSSPETWTARFPVPTPGQDPTLAPSTTSPFLPFDLVVTAMDTASNASSRTVHLWSERLPTVVAFAPTAGAEVGGEPFTVSLRDFPPDATVWIGDSPLVDQAILPAEAPCCEPCCAGVTTGITTIVGRVPAHGRAETLPISVLTTAGRTAGLGRYMVLPPPLIRGIEPPTGPTTGGIRVTVTGDALGRMVRLFVGGGTGIGGTPTDRREVPVLETFDPPDKLVACLPPGAGTVSLWAEDLVAGSSVPGAIRFRYLPPAMPTSLSPLASTSASGQAASAACPP